MKINNKQILTILVATVLVLVAFYAYTVKARMVIGEVDGYLIVIDKEAKLDDYGFFTPKVFNTTINLPGDTCTGTVSYCSYEFPAGVNAAADLNSDGKIDATDLQIFQEAFACDSTKACWNQPVDRCYFTFSNDNRAVRVRDPDHDCNMTQADIAIFQRAFNAMDISPTCELSDDNDACKSDMNKDGKVDMYDAVMLASKYGKYADVFLRLIDHKSKSDLNGDNRVDIRDAVLISNNYGKEALTQQCISSSLTHISGNQYGVSITARGLYFAGVTYSCLP